MIVNSIDTRPASLADYEELKDGEKNTAFADLLIDGKSLYRMLRKYDKVPSLGWMDSETQREMIDYFLLRKPHESMWYRYPIMVCPYCGDEGCGYISVKVDRENNIVTWKDFYLEPEMKKLNMGPFYFEWDKYKSVIAATYAGADYYEMS